MKSVFKDIIEHLLALYSRVLHIALGDEKGRSLERFVAGQVPWLTRIYHRNYPFLRFTTSDKFMQVGFEGSRSFRREIPLADDTIEACECLKAWWDQGFIQRAV